MQELEFIMEAHNGMSAKIAEEVSQWIFCVLFVKSVKFISWFSIHSIL